ncbi:hypothetical protein [Burkholderia diffusa]|uniref:hypothetical protein n=1 Tax=Burkholderia diffusa TaxID=488732 RepID=UPI0015813EBA|nr:hypothetical protein [Burkholderia diffusa]
MDKGTKTESQAVFVASYYKAPEALDLLLANRYVAYLAIATDDDFFTLIDLDKPEGECVDLVVGGQRGSYPLWQCDKATVIQAALHFCQFGKPDLSLNWQEG